MVCMYESWGYLHCCNFSELHSTCQGRTDSHMPVMHAARSGCGCMNLLLSGRSQEVSCTGIDVRSWLCLVAESPGGKG